MLLTYKYRIKDSNYKNELKYKANAVNQIWNYCNEISQMSAQRNNKWISEYDLNYLTAGNSKELKISSTTIQSVSKEYIKCRNKRRRPKLNWRSYKKSLGWIPFKASAIKQTEAGFKYCGKEYKCWISRPMEGTIKCGSFNEDSQGKWYINITCEVQEALSDSTQSVGIDLGLKTLATLSDGNKIENAREYSQLEGKLAVAQRAGHKKQARNIHKKIANRRKDYLHKETTKVVKQYKNIYVGNVSSSKLTKTRMAKSVNDASWSSFKLMLGYKALRLGVNFAVVNESYSSVTCSACSKRTGPSGLSSLKVRCWDCECGASHDRDVNAALNILRVGLGHEAPLGESPCFS